MTRGMAREMAEHTVRSYEEELRRLRDMIVRMGGLAEQQVADATSALVRRDTDLAAEVVQRDAQIDALEREVEAFVVRLLALRQPVGEGEVAELPAHDPVWAERFLLEGHQGDQAEGLPVARGTRCENTR